jgi:hypothetical protein
MSLNLRQKMMIARFKLGAMDMISKGENNEKV